MTQTDLFDDRDFYPTLLQLAVPIAMQQLVMSALGAVDVLIVGQLSATAVAAVGLAGQILFLLLLFHFGVGSGAAIFSGRSSSGSCPSSSNSNGNGPSRISNAGLL